jgi:hypothetical protein
VSLGGRAVGWLEAEAQQWLQRRIEASRAVEAGARAGNFEGTTQFLNLKL